MNKPDYEYVAFISYRHEPVGLKWATWLQDAIENYRVPWSLVKLGTAPRRVGKCFRDVGELAASADLSVTIDEALKASKYLVVICTPRTPHSKWVAEEIKRFRELGRGERILALLVEGEPRESFPPSLMEIRPSMAGETPANMPIQQLEPLAADLRQEIGAAGGHGRGHLRSMAKLRIIAALLGVNFDDLYNRDARRAYGRMLVTAGTALVIAATMIGLAVFAFVQKAEASRQRDTAKAFKDFLLQDVLSAATSEDVRNARTRDDAMRLMLESQADRVSERFTGQPLLEAEIRNTVAHTFLGLGRSDLALPHTRTVLDIYRRDLGAADPKTLNAMDHHAQALQDTGKLVDAGGLYREALEGWRKLSGPDTREAITALNNVGVLLLDQGDVEAAEPLLKEALDRSQRVLGEDDKDTGNSMCQYAGVLEVLKQYREAERLYRDALKASRRKLGDDNPDTLRIMNYLAGNLVRAKQFPEAEELCREALERRRRVLGIAHPETISSAHNYAFVMQQMGRWADAEPMFRIAAQAAHASPLLGRSEKSKQYAQRWIACLYALGRFDEAEAAAEEFNVTVPRPTTQPTIPPTTDDPIAQFVKRFVADWQ